MSVRWIPTGCSYMRDGKRVPLCKAVQRELMMMSMRYPVATNQCIMSRLYFDPLSMRELTIGLLERVLDATNIPDSYLAASLGALARDGLHGAEEIQLVFLVLYAYFPFVRDALHGHVNEAVEFLAPVYIAGRYIALASMLPPRRDRRRLTAAWTRSVLQPMYHEDYTTLFLGSERAADSLLFNNSLCQHVLGYCGTAHSALDSDEWFSFEYDSLDHQRVSAEYRGLVDTGAFPSSIHPDDMLAARPDMTWATQLLHTQLVFVLQKESKTAATTTTKLPVEDDNEDEDMDPCT